VRLVAIDERGDRRFALIEPPPPGALVRDTNPAISPDGVWLVFASSRGRADGTTALWLAKLGAEAKPLAVVPGDGVASHPVWTPDGRALVFASTRARGNFDLWRAGFTRDGSFDTPVQLTTSDAHELAPAIAADAIVYTEVTAPDGDNGAISRIMARTEDGATTAITQGPGDASPAISPDGRTIVFARPIVREASADGELWKVARAGGEPVRVIDLPLTDEGGPVWSPDGRYLFATSVLRGEAGVLFSSVIYVDLADRAPRARLLRDRGGAVERLTPALPTRVRIDHAALARNPEYLPELGRIIGAAIARMREGRDAP